MSKSQSLLQSTYQQIEVLPDSTTLLILHPAIYQHHRQIIYRLLKESDGAYLHLNSESGEDFAIFLNDLSDALREQADLSTGKLPGTPDKAAKKIAEAINSTGQFMLVIEGCDQVTVPAINTFLFTLAQSLESHRCLAVCGRYFPADFLDNRSNQRQTVMLPSLPEQLLVDYVNTPPDKHILEVRALGPTQALINGRSLTTWDGVLPRCLFYFMVDRAMTTRSDIFETFWENLEKREATNVFHVTKRKISEILGQDLTTYGSGFYRISDNIELHYDVVTFQEAVQNADIEEDEEEAVRLYEEAIRLYRGAFLSTLEQPWIEERRDELQQVYTDALTGLARIQENQGKAEHALGLYLRAAANIPHREDLVRTIMRIYSNLGQPERALESYERLKEELQDRLEVDPDPETDRLAAEIRETMQSA